MGLDGNIVLDRNQVGQYDVFSESDTLTQNRTWRNTRSSISSAKTSASRDPHPTGSLSQRTRDFPQRRHAAEHFASQQHLLQQ